MHLNIKAEKGNTYDAIVVGSGISGGWAAKELCEKGLKTLVLERGRNVEHVKDYTTAMMNPWEFRHRLQFTNEMKENYPIQSRCYAFDEATQQFWVNDKENPYNEVKPFNWLRGYQVGGRSLMWGRQCYRWSDLDFEANAKDGHGVDWPIRYKDIAPWYDYVERFAGVSGQAEGLPQLPDGQFLPPMEMNCLEKHVAARIREKYNDRIITIGRIAHATKPMQNGRQCQYRDLCARGCPYTGYFSSNGVTLPAAAATGNLTLRPDSIVTEVIYDEQKGRATGVRVLDAHTLQTVEYYANIIFLNGSTLGTAFILLNSVSNRFPNGLGNDSEQVGHNLMDHHYGVGASGEFDGFEDQYYNAGRRPNGIYIPRFRNVNAATRQKDYVRGFGYQGGAGRGRAGSSEGVGAAYKEAQLVPGKWGMSVGAWGEHLPYYENKVTLNKDKKDKYGLPTLDIDCAFRDNELAMRKDMQQSAIEMLEATGLKNVHGYDDMPPPGHCIHEMGTARMGKDPGTSVLNKWNQVHAVKNVFITDGACMTSSACQNPSITYMALTARAADYAVKEGKKGNI
ncbi:GMC oxidoreductase [Chitinophaga japonensis]|uniref:Choline dehydrogenase-like flavoprotein n=1 Tax=Chitinophaga japonensis TaxID=104662 RepID=A0A562T837_CHIJA|nr:GMC family oxidoreductase [Chitinophaga japonensis]TWI89136.1 choline dehydrogenase-like flavoprotein [Chitinophaga japonensis]